ncbi:MULTISPECIES: hypothetical protein [unclassified Rathayibacter]|uniref:hypothetical protein n=1 Tax=unclassified Rathayibacter TaxID=2609250 RepID=UPI00188BC9E3|nr:MULTISPECIES: hypothetical protein [unclassified Rathayibacter]MBF4463528.1 hypothetical protein [Rathayibacter sp. VKM Ac-2879]MBF4505022.1 hypothetical protein [Rathayibacter sp. VKM Ac-2878]
MRVKYRGFFKTLQVNPASEVFCNQERLPDMPEAFGIWPTGRLFLAEANSDGLVLHDRTGVVARIPRKWINGVEIDYVEFYRVQFAPAFVLSGADGVSLPFVPSSRIFPGNLGTTTRRTRRIADEFVKRLRIQLQGVIMSSNGNPHGPRLSLRYLVAVIAIAATTVVTTLVVWKGNGISIGPEFLLGLSSAFIPLCIVYYVVIGQALGLKSALIRGNNTEFWIARPARDFRKFIRSHPSSEGRFVADKKRFVGITLSENYVNIWSNDHELYLAAKIDRSCLVDADLGRIKFFEGDERGLMITIMDENVRKNVHVALYSARWYWVGQADDLVYKGLITMLVR